MNTASRIALNEEAALFWAEMDMLQGHGRVSGWAPMEIGNVEEKSREVL